VINQMLIKKMPKVTRVTLVLSECNRKNFEFIAAAYYSCCLAIPNHKKTDKKTGLMPALFGCTQHGRTSAAAPSAWLDLCQGL
jgi:hypothetical protein